MSKSLKCCTLMKANIIKEDVLKVIQSTDQIFIGHKLDNFQFSANAREKIVERALKCAEKPKIIFDYHPDQNYETFCNAILFNIPESTQAPQTVGCLRGSVKPFLNSSCSNFPILSGIFDCINCFKCCSSEDKSLGEHIKERLSIPK